MLPALAELSIPHRGRVYTRKEIKQIFKLIVDNKMVVGVSPQKVRIRVRFRQGASDRMTN